MFRIRPTALISIALAALSAAALSACGTEKISVADSNPMHAGAVLFQARCSGCHSLTAAGANGSASNIRHAQKTNGPNFNQRKETYERAVYAIQNGGFSGAIMPQNIVTGDEAKIVAAFVAKYSGSEVHTPPSPGGAGMTAAEASNAAATAKAASPAKTDLAALGATVFTQNGCGGCHQLTAAGANGQVGPSLNKVGTMPAADIRTSIVNPNAQITKGYAANIMPMTFGKNLSKQQIDALVAYLQKVGR